jgi:hypothetical protein
MTPVDLLILTLIWALLGALAGWLAHAARWSLGAYGLGNAHPALWSVGLGVGAAIVGGALGWVFFGRFFSTPNALWVSALAVTLGPWLVARLRRSPAA